MPKSTKHNRINRGLNMAIGALLLAMFASGTAVLKALRDCREHFRALDAFVSLREFFSGNLDDLSTHDLQEHNLRQAQLQSRLRSAALERQEHKVLRQRLKALLELSTDETERRIIEDCLAEDQPEAVKLLCSDLESRRVAETPEHRLHLLLESLKDYCDEVEFVRHAADASDLLAREGFRAARDFVVRLHAEMRKAAKTPPDLLTDDKQSKQL
jgi:hypothetical protein